MASLFSTTAALPCASTNTVPKLSFAKSVSNSRCSYLIGPFIVLDAESAVLANTLRKLKPYGRATVHFFHHNKPLVVYLPHVFARAYVRRNSGNSSNAQNDDGDGDDERSEQDIYDVLPDSEIQDDSIEIDGDGDDERSEQEIYDVPPDSEIQDDSIEIEIEKTGKNSRRIRSKIAVQASLQTVWNILTDYERLADFIPGLAVSQLVEKRDKFARLFQIGEQDLVLGLKFNAKGIIDCFEKDLEILSFGQKRDIEFKMVEGDFQLFEGVWSIEQGVTWNAGDLESDSVVDQQFQTMLTYVVHVKPKMWLPVRLVEGRLCNEIRKNLSSIRDEAEKAPQKTDSAL